LTSLCNKQRQVLQFIGCHYTTALFIKLSSVSWLSLIAHFVLPLRIQWNFISIIQICIYHAHARKVSSPLGCVCRLHISCCPCTFICHRDMDYYQLGLQAYHMRCKRRIHGVHWYEHVTNIAVARPVNFPHIGALIAARRYTLFSVTSSANLQMFQATWPSRCAETCPWTVVYKQHGSDPGVVRALCGLSRSSESDTGVSVATSWIRARGRRVQPRSGAERFSEWC